MKAAAALPSLFMLNKKFSSNICAHYSIYFSYCTRNKVIMKKRNLQNFHCTSRRRAAGWEFYVKGVMVHVPHIIFKYYSSANTIEVFKFYSGDSKYSGHV